MVGVMFMAAVMVGIAMMMMVVAVFMGGLWW